MKSITKRILITICAVSASAVLCTASVFASETPRPIPGNGSTTTTTATDLTTSSGSQADTSATTAPESPQTAVTTSDTVTNNVTQTATTSTSNTSNKKYLSKLGGFLWFLLSVVVNFILSCWVGNKFYQLARRNAQGSSEIRALRKDIEEKFASTLTDIAEPATEVLNSNENYARDEEGLSMPERRNHVEMNDEEREIVRRWDSKRAMSKFDEDEEYYDDEDEEYEEENRRDYRTSQRSYQPTRRRSGIEFEDDEEEDDEYAEQSYQKSRPARMSSKSSAAKSKKSSVGKKAKDFLSNVFPFDE